jgi:hypothetical protein
VGGEGIFTHTHTRMHILTVSVGPLVALGAHEDTPRVELEHFLEDLGHGGVVCVCVCVCVCV